MAYSMPRDVFLLLEEAFNHDTEKAEILAKAIEGSIQTIENQAEAKITDKKEALKAELYNELRSELATKEFVRAEISELKAELKTDIAELRTEFAELRAEFAELKAQVQLIMLWLKILVAITVFGLTLFNPSFVKLMELLAK